MGTVITKKIPGEVNGNNVYKALSGDTRTADINEVEKVLKAEKTNEEKQLASTQPGANSFKAEEKESPNSNNNSSETSNHEWSNCPHCQQAASQVKTKDEEIS